jgi:hypothetical protein
VPAEGEQKVSTAVISPSFDVPRLCVLIEFTVGVITLPVVVVVVVVVRVVIVAFDFCPSLPSGSVLERAHTRQLSHSKRSINRVERPQHLIGSIKMQD